MSTIRTSQLARDTQLLAGLEKNMASLPPLYFGGKSYTPSDCVSVVQARVDAGNKAVTAKGAAHKAVQDNHDEIKSTKSFVDQLIAALLLAYSNAPDTLADFGLRPKKKSGPKTVETKVVAAAKRDATRKARHTMGSRQKALVKGSVPATLTIDVPQPAPVVTSTGPEGTAGNGVPPQASSNGPSQAPVTAPKGS